MHVIMLLTVIFTTGSALYYISHLIMNERLPYVSSIQYLFTTRYQFNVWLLLTEIFTLIVVLTMIYVADSSIELIRNLIFTLLSVMIIVIDFKKQIIPHILSLPIIVLGIVCSSIGSYYYSELYNVAVYDSVLGAVLGCFFPWFINFLFSKIRKKDGMGYGDFVLLSGVGALLGYNNVVWVLFYASALHIVMVLIDYYILRKKQDSINTPFAFGPAIILGAYVQIWFVL